MQAPELKGFTLKKPTYLSVPLSKNLEDLSGFYSPTTFYPGLSILTGVTLDPKSPVWLDHRKRVISSGVALSNSSSGRIQLTIETNGPTQGLDVEDISGFRKITHLLDPVRWIQGKYDPESIKEKLSDAMNQAYVEALATYSLGKLREENISPHFHAFYGAFSAEADTYAYNISDSYLSYRHCRWFWTGQEKDIFKLCFDESLPEDIKNAILDVPDNLEDDSDFDSDSDSEECLDELDTGSYVKETIGSIRSMSEDELETVSGSEKEEEEEEEEEDDEEDEDDESNSDVEIFAKVKKFPVMMIFTESSENTMDSLLDNYQELECEPGSEKWEAIWTAWIFQVIAALTVVQRIFGFTHNDLHTNNIVWERTDKEFLFYKSVDGTIFRIPTFGKIFKIIDFGRSIFKINETIFYSDDFRKGNDAGDQYCFGDLKTDNTDTDVHPNPSFDLSRFTVSLFDSLFPEPPPKRKNGAILSKEPGLIIKETESDLYNLLWSWLLCDDGHNVLIDANGDERYPDFDLYKVIAAKVHGAIPSQQLRKPIFECFHFKQSLEDQKVYALFV